MTWQTLGAKLTAVRAAHSPPFSCHKPALFIRYWSNQGLPYSPCARSTQQALQEVSYVTYSPWCKMEAKHPLLESYKEFQDCRTMFLHGLHAHRAGSSCLQFSDWKPKSHLFPSTGKTTTVSIANPTVSSIFRHLLLQLQLCPPKWYVVLNSSLRMGNFLKIGSSHK